MFLSHQSIEKYVDEGKIRIAPQFDKKNIRPAGIRMHLAQEILIPQLGQTVELNKPQELKYEEIDLCKEKFILEPGQFILGATFESLEVSSDILPLLDGRSTIARLGLTTHITATVIDGAFNRPHTVVLEIKNVGNFKIRLKYRDPIAMMIFAELKEPVIQKMQRQYGEMQKVTPPNMHFLTGEDF